MVYNLTRIVDNSTGLLGFTQGVNEVLMGGWLGVLLLIGLTMIILISYIYVTNDTSKSVTAASFIALTLALLLRAVNLLADKALFITLILCAVTLAISINKGNN